MLHFLKHIDEFESMSLTQLDKFDFEKRVDTKFIFHEALLPDLLKNLAGFTKMLELDGERVFDIRNSYFDTPDFSYYYAHHRGLGNRLKVRIRSYGKYGFRYLEVKRKNNKKQTLKRRLKLHKSESIHNQRAVDFLEADGSIQAFFLEEKMKNNFRRITLVNHDFTEKFTLDFNLSFEVNGQNTKFENLAIAEIKQPKFSVNSELFRAMKQLKVRPTSFSKYCMGLVMNTDFLKKNNFKPAAKKIQKIRDGYSDL